MKSPLSVVKDKFGDKQKLVAAIEKLAGDDLWVSRTNAKKGLAHVANAKLLRLHATFDAVKGKFGSRDKLVAAILDLEKRTKDEGYKTRLSAYPVPRLWDMYRALEKRVARADQAAKAAPAKAPAKPKTAKPKAPKKAAAKKPE